MEKWASPAAGRKTCPAAPDAVTLFLRAGESPPRDGRTVEHFQFETLCVSNHTVYRFAEKTRFFRLIWAGRRCAAFLCFLFFKGKTLYPSVGPRPVSSWKLRPAFWALPSRLCERPR